MAAVRPLIGRRGARTLVAGIPGAPPVCAADQNPTVGHDPVLSDFCLLNQQACTTRAAVIGGQAR